MEPLEVRAHRLGATLRVHARPGAARTAPAGVHAGALRLAVAAPPEKGKANREILRYLARVLAVPKADLELLAGELARDKVVLCRGLSAETLAARAGRLVDEKEDTHVRAS